MKIKSVEYEIEPFDKFLRVVIFQEDEKFRLGISYAGNFGTESFIVFKNLIIEVIGYIRYKKI